jgi:hypothetical protein
MGLFALFHRNGASQNRKKKRRAEHFADFGARVVASVKDIRFFSKGDLFLNPDVVRREEMTDINKRRKANGRASVAQFRGFRGKRKKPRGDPVYDTVGLALSGGGVRSAAFCLGATQALDVAGVFKRIDYLSTVSGGGYIGSTISAGMTLDQGRFPVPSVLRRDEPPVVQHIRDYSNYLIPHGFIDVIRSVSVYLRGLVANVLLILPWLLFLAALTIVLNPTRGSLQTTSFLAAWWARLSSHLFFDRWTWVGEIANIHGHFAITCSLLGALLLALAAWSIRRSFRSGLNQPEIPGLLSTLFFWFLILIGVAAFLEFQPYALDAMFDVVDSGKSNADKSTFALFIDWMRKVVLWLTPAAAAVGMFGNKLTWLTKGVTESSRFTLKLRSVAIQVLIYAAAAIVPLLIWLIYMQLAFWGILNSGGIAAPGWLKIAARWLADNMPPQFVAAAEALQAQAVVWINANLPAVASSPDFYHLLSFYLATFVVLGLLSWLLEPNANSLHRLYRDRLSKAFLICPTEKIEDPSATIDTIKSLPLSDLANTHAPYHLINAALNIQASRSANRRGRNADFFLFSGGFVGSPATGYVRTAQMEKVTPEVDLATAMAISGAAASSNMGTSSIRGASPSLAILNVRLGYWLRNPKYLFGANSLWSKLHDIFNLYFLYEMLGLLSERRPFIYLTDGGHVENLGAYELLRRRCSLIILVDAEADPGMHFTSLVRLERYARIDLGIRLELPWQQIRSATLETSEKIKQRGDPGELLSRTGPHCAVGKIYYPGGEGRILYVKSSMTGDESSYVVDYKRRNESFPHETTGDQFFSEEQFEAYRALGFHAVQGFFSDRDDVALPAVKTTGTGAERFALGGTEQQLKSDVIGILKPKETEVLPTMVGQTEQKNISPEAWKV